MEAQLKEILSRAQGEANGLETRAQFDQYKARFVGPKGELTDILKGMGKLPKEERPAMGQKINAVKQELEAVFAQVIGSIEARELQAKIGPAIDPTLPAVEDGPGSAHPLKQIREEINRIFRKLGFTVAECTEVDTEYYCFDALNTPDDHPARDLQDTYYLKPEAKFSNIRQKADERYLLRTQTSTVQIRTMLKGKPPLRIISPGRCFRRDSTDATHSANFHQVEGLYVDYNNVTVRDLKAALDYFLQELFGKDAKTRFRPHFFPYTEPSFEVDVSCGHLRKVGKEWIEIMGCGMVDPAVFEAVGYDPRMVRGYAFGMGIERIAMILYGVDDIRHFYQNDLRFLKQFA